MHVDGLIPGMSVNVHQLPSYAF